MFAFSLSSKSFSTFSFPLPFQLCVCVVLVSCEVLTPELAASGGGCECRTCCLDIAWFSAVS